MANTTFTGNVRANGNGNRANYAGSMSMVAQFHVPATNAAAGTDAQVSATDTRTVQLPKGSIVDTDGFVDNGAADDSQEMILPNSATAGNDLGLTEMTHDIKIVAGQGAAAQAGTLTGTIFYHMVDDGKESA